MALTVEEIESCGWVKIKEYTAPEEGFVFQLFKSLSEEDTNEDFWEMNYNLIDNSMKIENWKENQRDLYSSNTILDCKIHSLKDLKQEMDWLGIKTKK